MTDVFISYKKEDVARVEPIARALADAGYEVWWDHRIPPGHTYRDVIGAALETAKCVIVVWSKLSANAQWVLDEADEGKKRNVLLPLVIDEVDIPYGFRQIEAARLVGWAGDTNDHEWMGVISAVQHFVGRPPGGPPKPLSIPSFPTTARTAARETRVPSGGGPRLAGPLLGVVAVALLGGGGYYAWQSGLLTPLRASAPSADEDVNVGPPIDMAAADEGGVTDISNPALPASTRRDVQVPGDEFATYFQSGYVYCDAKILGAFWGQDIGEIKATIGWKILNGLGANVPTILQLARNNGHVCDWSDTGHTYADAERLAAVWGMSEPYEAKLRVSELYTQGRSDIVQGALRGA